MLQDQRLKTHQRPLRGVYLRSYDRFGHLSRSDEIVYDQILSKYPFWTTGFFNPAVLWTQSPSTTILETHACG